MRTTSWRSDVTSARSSCGPATRAACSTSPSAALPLPSRPGARAARGAGGQALRGRRPRLDGPAAVGVYNAVLVHWYLAEDGDAHAEQLGQALRNSRGMALAIAMEMRNSTLTPERRAFLQLAVGRHHRDAGCAPRRGVRPWRPPARRRRSRRSAHALRSGDDADSRLTQRLKTIGSHVPAHDAGGSRRSPAKRGISPARRSPSRRSPASCTNPIRGRATTSRSCRRGCCGEAARDGRRRRRPGARRPGVRPGDPAVPRALGPARQPARPAARRGSRGL